MRPDDQFAIEWAAWVDAKDLKPGYELLNPDDTWAEVVSVSKVDTPLTAYNLTVDEFSTFFVAANDNAEPVWVHNTCAIPNPYGRRGSPETRAQIDAIGADLETNGYRVTSGAFDLPETAVTTPEGLRRYPDITAVNETTGQTIYINTVDVRADGFTPTTRELRAASDIARATGCVVCLWPKPGAGPQ